jgi:hypothetical protein
LGWAATRGRGNGLCCGKGEGGLGRLRSWAGKEKGERREKGKGFQISKSTQANEFKPRFESKHPKIMHQHECNSKLLYFIN